MNLYHLLIKDLFYQLQFCYQKSFLERIEFESALTNRVVSGSRFKSTKIRTTRTITAFNDFKVGPDGHVYKFNGEDNINDAVGNDLDTDGFLLTPNLNSITLEDGLTIVAGNLALAVDAGAYLTAAEIATFCADLDPGTGGNQTITVSNAADRAYLLVEGQAGNSTLALVTPTLFPDKSCIVFIPLDFAVNFLMHTALTA